MAHQTVTGGCFCGTVRFEISLPVQFCVHCHCSMCRRAHGAAYVTWIAVERDELRMTSGSESLVPYKSSDHGVRTFCRTCGSTLFCESNRHPTVVDIVLANLDGDVGKAPEAHIYYGHRADWTDARDDLPKLGGASGMEPLPSDD